LPKAESKASLPKAESNASLPKAESKASLPKAESKAKESLPINAKKCPKGTRRNRRTCICEPKIVPLQLEPIQAKQPRVEAKHPEVKQLSRCPKGTHRNKKTGECVPNK
jgi:hypothetical protein